MKPCSPINLHKGEVGGKEDPVLCLDVSFYAPHLAFCGPNRIRMVCASVSGNISYTITARFCRLTSQTDDCSRARGHRAREIQRWPWRAVELKQKRAHQCECAHATDKRQASGRNPPPTADNTVPHGCCGPGARQTRRWQASWQGVTVHGVGVPFSFACHSLAFIRNGRDLNTCPLLASSGSCGICPQLRHHGTGNRVVAPAVASLPPCSTLLR